MKKLITICLLLALAFTVNAQDLTKEQTLNYIKDVYSQINKVYLSGNDGSYYSSSQTLDSLKLEHDELISFFTIKEYDGKILKKIIRTKISGIIKVDWKECLINDKGDKFMFVQEGNKAQLERLKNAVIHLQEFITKDPFDK